MPKILQIILLVFTAATFFLTGYVAGLHRYAALEGVEMPVYQLDELFSTQGQ